MYSYKEQLRTIKAIPIRDGQTLRMNCPFCGGHNSFGLSKLRGVLKWGCFRASCQTKGQNDAGRSIEDIRRYQMDGEEQAKGYGAPIPELLTMVNKHSDILAYLQSVNSLRAYEEGLATVLYSPTEDRTLFMLADNVGATGRAITGVSRYRPKWKKYGDTSHIFSCGNGSTGVIVEDAPSACATGVVRGYTGISILGTHLTTQHKLELRRFERILVCLDPDAAQLGLDMVRRLSGTVDVSLRLIKDDLKYFPPEDIEAMLASFT